MEDRVVRLESQVAYLSDRVGSLEERLAVLEAATPAVVSPAEPASTLSDLVGLPATPPQQWLGLVGRTLVILGGAYLLRALTGSRVLPIEIGVAAGLLYGAPWLLLASRAAARGAHVDAFAHALTTALIGYPLVWEATLRFGALTPAQSAMLLGALTTGALLLAFARELHGLAWVVTAGALLSAGGLAIGMGNWTPYTLLAGAIGIATLWLGYVRNWTLLRWPAAFAADLMLLVVTGRAAVSGATRAALIVQMLMLAAYLGSFAIRTLVIGREVIPFEVVQSIGVLAVAFGGAIALIHSTGANVVPVGIASLVLAASGYLVAFAFVERRRHAKNFFFYGLLALVFAIVGVVICTGPQAGAAVFAITGGVAVALARRYHRFTISLHAAVYVLAGSVISGLLSSSTLAIVAPAALAAIVPTAAGVFVLLVLVLAVLPIGSAGDPWTRFTPPLRAVLLATLIWAASGALIGAGVLLLGGRAIDASVLATLRTAVLVGACLALAAMARTTHGREAAWLVYPLLALVGLKLLFADFPSGRPDTLFIALASYGCALIAVPRLMRRREPVRAAAQVD